MGELDAAYRRLFQHKELLRDLLVCVLDPSLFDALDWDRMQPVPTSYVSDQLRQRIGDCAWLIPGKQPARLPGGTDIQASMPSRGLCILLILEQQDRTDAVMALRIVTYTGLTYQTLLRSKEVRLPLPPVLPVVLYSGRRPWRASLDLSGLIGEIPADLRPYQPQMRYLLVHERDLLKGLGQSDQNLAALLFRLGHGRDVEEWRGLLHTLIQVVRTHPGYEELSRSLTAWLRLVVQRSVNPAEALPPVKTLEELDMMIAEKPGIWARQWKREGRVEGRVEGQADLLLHQIQRRFGPAPDDVTQRIRTAQTSQLKAWSLNILDAGTLEDVFRD